MDITYLGHSSFRIKGRNVSVITDPYDSSMVGLKFPQSEADIVTSSHEHADHNNTEAVKNYKKVFSRPGEYEVMGVSFIGIPSLHDNKNGEERGKNTIFVIEVDELRICHLGDLGQKLSEAQATAIGHIDILIVPVGGKYTIGPKEAMEVVGQIEPLIIIPMHYLVDGMNKESFADLEPVDNFLKESGMTVEKLPKLSIKKEELLDDQPAKVVVLEIK